MTWETDYDRLLRKARRDEARGWVWTAVVVGIGVAVIFLGTH